MSKTSLDLLLSTADRYAYNLASPSADEPSSSSLLLMRMILLLLLLCDSSCLFVQSSDPLFICVEIVCAF